MEKTEIAIKKQLGYDNAVSTTIGCKKFLPWQHALKKRLIKGNEFPCIPERAAPSHGKNHVDGEAAKQQGHNKKQQGKWSGKWVKPVLGFQRIAFDHIATV